jgi:hypothetical protein
MQRDILDLDINKPRDTQSWESNTRETLNPDESLVYFIQQFEDPTYNARW